VEKKESIIGLLRDHIFGQIVVANGNVGDRPALQRNGIPQGSILSSLFCNIYFGNLEDFLLDGVFDESSIVIKGSDAKAHISDALIKSLDTLNLLVRIVDDFLLISTDHDTSVRFLKKLTNGT
jgi:telomerase reverse transcriptase